MNEGMMVRKIARKPAPPQAAEPRRLEAAEAEPRLPNRTEFTYNVDGYPVPVEITGFDQARNRYFVMPKAGRRQELKLPREEVDEIVEYERELDQRRKERTAQERRRAELTPLRSGYRFQYEGTTWRVVELRSDGYVVQPLRGGDKMIVGQKQLEDYVVAAGAA